MNTILLHIILDFHKNEYLETPSLNFVDYVTVVEAIVSTIILVIGVVLGTKYITTTRKNAQFGFYVNLLVLIERFRAFLSDNATVTNYLVEESVRITKLPTTIPKDQAVHIIPLFVSLCDEFLVLVQSSNNIIAPKRKKRSLKEQEKDWNDWYESICKLVNFSQKCKLLEKNITPYISEEQIPKYNKEKKEFLNAIEFIYNILQESLEYQTKFKDK